MTKNSPRTNLDADGFEKVRKTAGTLQRTCAAPPIGCGKPIGFLKHRIDFDRYRESGLCKECQTKYKVFGKQ